MATLSARYNNNSGRALDNGTLHALAPSIFAEQAAHDRSEKYTFIPTIQVVEALRSEGFYPVAAAESKARKEEKHGYTKHVIRFRQHDGFTTVGETKPEIVLLNSHDGTSSYQLSAGLFRLVCSNGLIVADGAALETIKCRHSGNVVDNVIEGTYKIIEEMPNVLQSVEEMKALIVPEKIQTAFARHAAGLRWDAETMPIDPDRLNRANRREDLASDLFTTMNRVQENIIRGGIRGRNANGGRLTTRAVNSVTENVRLNKAVWAMAEEIKTLLAA
jgi:hypothetical protein